MAQSTAEEIAALLPESKRIKSNGLFQLVWRRNSGYLNRKVTSTLFDMLELLSLALLSDIDSLKYFYFIWIIFYFTQSILESLFYTARKIFVYDKHFPTKRTLAYIHILVWTIPFFFVMVSFDKFSQNNIAIIYLFYKSVVLMFQTITNYVNFEMQTLSRVFYPPRLNWILLSASIALIVTIQNISNTFISFLATLTVFFTVKMFQEIVMLKKSQELKSSILWQLKRSQLTDVNTAIEFLTLLSIEVFLPLSILTMPHETLNIKTMSQIFLIYMVVKLFMRPIRSLILDLWSLSKENNKFLILTTSVLASITAIVFYLIYPSSQDAIMLGFNYFLFLLIWNTRMIDNKAIVGLLLFTFIASTSGVMTQYLAIINTVAFIYCFYKKFKQPNNLKRNSRFDSFDDKYIISFKSIPRWSRMAKKYPELMWSPLGKKRCVIESLKQQDSDIQNFILSNSYEIKSIEKMDLTLAKKLNIS